MKTLSDVPIAFKKAGGVAILVLLWWLVVLIVHPPKTVMPSPIGVLLSFPELHFEDQLVRNAAYSLKLNLLGYLEAIAIALPLGFILGLQRHARLLFESTMSATRFIPLSAVTGLFILYFGIGDKMKVQFLAFGILVYLLPAVVQRLDEVNQTHIDTVTTLGASKWQLFKAVHVPATLSSVFVDIRLLVAISWTYIIIPELINRQDGGIGALIYSVSRNSRADKAYAALIVIALIGVAQDRIFKLLDRFFFPYKYAQKRGGGA